MTRLLILEGELAAYSPGELMALSETVSILLETADDRSRAFRMARTRIENTLARAVKNRMAAERTAGRTAIILPFKFQ